MHIESDTKLDFKDVLIRPKRSTLASRSEVDIRRDLSFKWSGRHYEGVPLIAANMDGVGTLAMARAFIANGNGLTVALTKHYPVEALVDFYKKEGNAAVWYSIGTSDKDTEKLDAFLAQGG